MAKANLVLPDGTTVDIEGTADEVAILLAKMAAPAPTKSKTTVARTVRHKSNAKSTPVGRKKKVGPVGLMSELAAEDFFKTKRLIGDIQKKLEERGHIYAVNHLSPALLKLTQKKLLRRLKEKD